MVFMMESFRFQLSEYSANEINGAKLVVFENSSHAPFIEEIDRFNQELVSFIES